MADLFAISGVYKDISQHVIFFHGLGGHPYDTWRLSSDADVLWPQWLAEDIEGLAVWTVGYEAAVSRWRGSAMHLTDRATNVLERLLAEPKLQRDELTFIGHSLGGLLIKQVLRIADSMAHQRSEIANFIKRIRRVAFIATPHSGAGLAAWGDRLRILIRPSLATTSLVRNDRNLQDLNLWYREWSTKQHVEHLILTETKTIRLCGLIVSPDSADPGLCRPIPIDANHITICKPGDRTSDVYIHVREFIARPIKSQSPEMLIENALTAQTTKIESLRDELREQNAQLQTAISDQEHRTSQIDADRLIDSLSRIASSTRPYPKDLVDSEIQNRLSTIRRARFFRGFSLAERSMGLGETILKGELAGGSDAIKSNALAWCARFLVPGEHSDKANDFLSRAKEMGAGPEIAIAESFIISARGATDLALTQLASLRLPIARSAAFRIVSQYRNATFAIEWLSKSGLTASDLDPDGKLFLITNLFQLKHWDKARDLVVEIRDDEFQHTPALLHIAAMCHLMQAIPDDLKSLVLNQIPLEANRFPLASTESSLKSRRRAQELFRAGVLVAHDLGCEEAANTAEDYALWLGLRDPERHAVARQALEESMRGPKHALRRLPFALQFGLKVDLEAVEQEIEHETVLSGGHSRVAAMARFSVAFTKRNPKEMAEYIDQHRLQLLEILERKSLTMLEIELLARANFPQRAEERLTELINDGLSETEKIDLQRIIAESGSDPLETQKAQFETSGKFADLVNLVNLLERRNDWSQLCHYGTLLFERTQSLADAERLARALNQTNRHNDLATFLRKYLDLVAQSDDLQLLWSWSLYRAGSLSESRDALKDLETKRDHPNVRALIVNLAIASGDWESLLPYLETEWKWSEHREANELLQATLLAQIVDSPRTKDFLYSAAAKGTKNPAILAGAYTIATNCGWENEPSVAAWLHKAAELSDENGPLQKVSLKELVDRAPEWNRRETDAWQYLYDGTLPIFGVARLLNRTLVETFLLPAIANPTEPDPRRRVLIPAYSGARAPLACDYRVIAVDATALLTLGILGLLEEMTKCFRTLYIPHSTLAWLFEEKQKLKFHQPSRIKYASALRGLQATGLLNILSTTTKVDADLAAEIGDELAAMIGEAMMDDAGDGRQRLVVRSAPVHRINSLMEEEADLSNYSTYLCGCSDIVGKLKQLGQLTTSEEARAREYLSLHEKGWPHKPTVATGAILYLDDLAVTYLQHINVLSKLRPAGFEAYFSARKRDEINSLLRYDELSSEIEAVIDRLRTFLALGIKNGTVKVGPMQHFDGQEGSTFEHHPTIAVFHLALHADAVIADDRFLNQHRFIENRGSRTPILTTLDVLDVFYSGGSITFDQFLDCRTKLRRAGYVFIPATSGEIENYLTLAEVVDGRIVETAELKVIRESLLRIRMSSFLQLPKEALWLDGVMQTLTHVLKAQWRADMNESVARARSEWVLDMLDLRGWAHRLDAGDFKQIVERGHGAQLMSLLMSPRDISGAVEDKYLEWTDECILKPLRDQNPELYGLLIDRIKELIARVVERKVSE